MTLCGHAEWPAFAARAHGLAPIIVSKKINIKIKMRGGDTNV